MLKLAYKYMRYYKSQTFAIMASIILTAALLSGISSLLYSSQMNSLENNKRMYGDWHYCVDVSPEVFQSVRSGEEDTGFSIAQCGKAEIRAMVTEPYPVYFINTDEAYREMAHRGLIEGTYPEREREIAADQYTLGNLGFSGEVGNVLNINGEEYILTGIMKNVWASGTGEMEIFVGEGFTGQGSRPLLYLRFDEGERLYKQLDAFLRKYYISSDEVKANDEVVMYLGGEQPDSIAETLRFALTDEKGNFTYIVLKLQSEYNLSFYGMIFLLCIFSLFIVHSIFHISVSRRIAEYGIMQTIGISEGRIGGTLILELWLLFFAGYPVGCLLGNGLLKIFYRYLSHAFSGETGAVSVSEETKSAVFYVAWDAMLIGFFFLLVTLAFVGFVTVYSMRRQTVYQAMRGDTSFIKRRRKIYSMRNRSLVGVVVRKFMFSDKKKVIGMILSLSLGGCIFLCTTYMVENLKVHAEMSLKSEDGLGAEYRISLKSNVVSDTIPEKVADEIRNTPELSKVYATKYTLGELIIRKEELEWDEYFDQMNEDSYFKERFGGICVEKEGGFCGIKYDVYGYAPGMIEELKEFVLEGEIDLSELEAGNQIIAVANRDGQGNYDFYGKHPGDTVTLRVPKDFGLPELLKFQSADENYVEEEFEIAAIVSRALAKEDHFLNGEVWKDMQSFIITDRQMTERFGISGYSFINASLADGAEGDEAGSQLLSILQDVPKAVLQDYTAAIEMQKDYLVKQQLFFSGIAVILLVISLFHIMNSMNYSILSRRREYGIIRAMGITDIGFYQMILRMGVMYGILADIFIFLIYNIVLRRIMDYYMAHVVQFLHFTEGVPGGILAGIMILNVLIAAAAVMIPAGRIVRSDIVRELG